MCAHANTRNHLLDPPYPTPEVVHRVYIISYFHCLPSKEHTAHAGFPLKSRASYAMEKKKWTLLKTRVDVCGTAIGRVRGIVSPFAVVLLCVVHFTGLLLSLYGTFLQSRRTTQNVCVRDRSCWLCVSSKAPVMTPP